MLMEARKLEPADHDFATNAEPCEFDQAIGWRHLGSLIHPLVWACITALWLGLVCLVLFEASHNPSLQ